MSETPGKAVFLSYASQDAEAARSIADALRAFGIEVWFDRHELRGGDAWDQKIRKQIQECTLFLPIISTATQERREGYFRREWKLAADRTNDIAEGAPFIVPVALDDIPQSIAAVPEQFLRVQWTRLTHGVATPEFVAQVKRLLEAPWRPGPAGTRSGAGGAASVAPRRRVPLWATGAATAAVLAVVGYFALRQPAIGVAVPKRSESVTRSAPTTVSGKSIAVLPFVNRSTEKDNEFFTDGMHEDVLTQLSRIGELRVTSRTSVEQYRGTKKAMKQIGEELKVAYLLEGSVQRSGDKVRVTGQLIRAATDEHVWARNYDRNLTAAAVFAIQSELAQAIAGELKARLTADERKAIERRPTNNLEAYDLYLRERVLRNAGFRRQAERIPLLESAVTLDPHFAEAWAELSAVLAEEYRKGNARNAEVLAKAGAALENAVRLGPDLLEVILAQGRFHQKVAHDQTRAREYFERARRLFPTSAEPSYHLTRAARNSGRMIEAAAHARDATRLDPTNPRMSLMLFATLRSGRRHLEARSEALRFGGQQYNGLPTGFILAQQTFYATGDPREVATYFASAGSEGNNSTALRRAKVSWALQTGDSAEYARLQFEQRATVGGKKSNTGRTVRFETALFLAADGKLTDARAELSRIAEVRKICDSDPFVPANWIELAQWEALLGEKEAALAAAHRAMALAPEAQDAEVGAGVSTVLPFVLSWTGEKDRAIAEYARLLQVPGSSLNVHVMRQHPAYTPLRGDPRWEALLNDPKNNAPLF